MSKKDRKCAGVRVTIDVEYDDGTCEKTVLTGDQVACVREFGYHMYASGLYTRKEPTGTHRTEIRLSKGLQDFQSLPGHGPDVQWCKT